jgi:hypothetical protein
MWIWIPPKCSISLHNQEFYTLARPFSYAKKSSRLRSRQFHCCSLIRCNYLSLNYFINFNIAVRIILHYMSGNGEILRQEKTRIPLLTQSEVGQRLLFSSNTSVLGLIASNNHLSPYLHPAITAASPPRHLGNSTCVLTITKCSQRNRPSLSSPPPSKCVVLLLVPSPSGQGGGEHEEHEQLWGGHYRSVNGGD